MISFTREQIFLVTGASSGIGKGIALLLNKLGATVVGIARDTRRLETLKVECSHPENLFIETKDLTENIAELPEYIKSLREKYGKFSGMAHCAGITQICPLRILNYQAGAKLFDINYFVPMFLLKGLLDKRNNIGKGTACVLISSLDAIRKDKGMAEYSASKAALTASVRCIAKEVAPNIRINTISPGDVDTPMTQNLKEQRNDRLSMYPLGFGEVADVAGLAAFLLSDISKWISGEDYHMGGLSI